LRQLAEFALFFVIDVFFGENGLGGECFQGFYFNKMDGFVKARKKFSFFARDNINFSKTYPIVFPQYFMPLLHKIFTGQFFS
jgi:hypothetical protein